MANPAERRTVNKGGSQNTLWSFILTLVVMNITIITIIIITLPTYILTRYYSVQIAMDEITITAKESHIPDFQIEEEMVRKVVQLVV